MIARKLAVFFGLLLMVETWGVVGASRVQGIRYTCTTEIGPLCFAWQESVIGKLLPEDQSDAVEEAFVKARDDFDERFIQRVVKRKSSAKTSMSGIVESAEEAYRKAKEAAGGLLDAVQGNGDEP